MAKRKKSKKNKNAFGKILLLIILVGIIGVVVYFGYDNYIEVQKEYDNLEEVMVRTDDLVDKVISSDINLSSLITDDSAVVASWTSSNSKYLTSEGRVTRPTYTEGDKVVTLTVTYTLSFKDKITQIVYNFVKQEEKTASYVIRVLASEATDSEKTALALESLNVPEAIYDNIELPTSYPLFESVTITWKNNEQDIENTSEVSGEEITLIATATSNNISKSETFKVQVKNEQLTITTVAQDFNDVSVSSRYNSFKDKGVDFTNARVFEYTTSEETDESETGDYSDRYIRLRTEGEALSGFVTPAIANFSNMSFSYIYAGTQTGLESSFKISASVDNQKTFIVIDEVTILHVEEKTKIEITGDNLKSKGIDLTKTVIIKVEHTTTFASCYVDIDDIVITRDVNKNDFIEAVISEIPTSSNKYFNLPFTTKYGGNITYESSNTDIVSSSGVVKTVPEISTTVNLTGTISFNGEEYTFTVELKITGTTVSAPIEIYFFDIGKYGTSDCGESIYIKFGSIDILVDAGDNFTASKQAIEEGINAHLDDGILDYVIATHPDADHIGGMTNVFEKYQVENLIVFDGEHTSQKYRNFKEAYEKEECNVLNIYDDIISKNEEVLRFDEQFYLEFIDTGYLNADTSKETNGRSIVFMLYAYDTKMLFTGDADSQGAHPDLESNYQDKVGNIDILKVVHHGTKEGTSSSFIKAIDPEMAIICNGNYLGNKHSHPHVQAISNLYNYDQQMQVYCITGGGLDCDITSNGGYKGTSANSDVDRNGTLTLLIYDNNEYTLTAELNEIPIMIKDTTFWKNYLTANK